MTHTSTHRLKTSKQLRIACSECTCTVFSGCCDDIKITGELNMLNVQKHMKVCCLCSLIVEEMLSEWLVATRHSPPNFAHARISKF
jgi:hypothetical protein